MTRTSSTRSGTDVSRCRGPDVIPPVADRNPVARGIELGQASARKIAALRSRRRPGQVENVAGSQRQDRALYIRAALSNRGRRRGDQGIGGDVHVNALSLSADRQCEVQPDLL